MDQLISIVIPVRNGGNFLEACLKSVAAANRDRFEVIVSDNRSTDDTRDILARFMKEMPTLRIHTTEQDLSLQDNVNFAAQQATGLWLKFLCHDDLLFPEALDCLSQAIRSNDTPQTALVGNQEVHLFSAGYQTKANVDSKSELDAQWWPGRNYLLQFLSGGGALPSLTTACVKRSVFERFGGFDRKWLHLDTFLWCRMLLDYDFIHINNALTVNRIHGRQVAAEVRRINLSKSEHRFFWPEFMDELAKRQTVGWGLRIRMKVKWVLVAATDAAISWRKGRHLDAFRILASTGAFYFLISLAAFGRALVVERKRVKAMMPFVPLDQIYPG